MNNALGLGLIACISVAGLIIIPFTTGYLRMEAQAQKLTTATTTPKVKNVTLIADEMPVQIASNNTLHPGGIVYNAMVFNGTIPGPIIAVDQGDILQVTFKNNGKITHSLIFQGVNGPTQAISGNIKPGESRTWTLKAVNPGVFLYYGGGDALNNVWEHIADGMYGGLVVYSPNEKPAKEFYLVFGENYNTADQGLFKGTNGTAGSFDVTKFINDQPDLVLTNGMAHKYLGASHIATSILSAISDKILHITSFFIFIASAKSLGFIL
jgi:nitrite reductase (NO-forming)